MWPPREVLNYGMNVDEYLRRIMGDAAAHVAASYQGATDRTVAGLKELLGF